jgi:hypothetical protein
MKCKLIFHALYDIRSVTSLGEIYLYLQWMNFNAIEVLTIRTQTNVSGQYEHLLCAFVLMCVCVGEGEGGCYRRIWIGGYMRLDKNHIRFPLVIPRIKLIWSGTGLHISTLLILRFCILIIFPLSKTCSCYQKRSESTTSKFYFIWDVTSNPFLRTQTCFFASSNPAPISS